MSLDANLSRVAKAAAAAALGAIVGSLIPLPSLYASAPTGSHGVCRVRLVEANRPNTNVHVLDVHEHAYWPGPNGWIPLRCDHETRWENLTIVDSATGEHLTSASIYLDPTIVTPVDLTPLLATVAKRLNKKR